MSSTDTLTQPPDAPYRRARSALWFGLAVGLAVALLLVEYLILRLISSPIMPVLITVTVLLIALSVTGYLGSRRGHAAPFVAVALILPYLIVGVGAAGTYQRVKTELANIFDATAMSDGGSIEKTEGNPYGTANSEHGSADDFVDEDEDGVDDRTYAGANCSAKNPYDGYYDECMANGGADDRLSGVDSSGLVEGDPGYVDKNGDGVDDHFYQGADCRAKPLGDIEGGQQEFADCDANGGVAP